MSNSRGVASSGGAVIGRDTILEGEIRGAGAVEVFGEIKGIVATDSLTVHSGARVFGTVRARDANVNGVLEGDIGVRALMVIGASGEVRGKVKYGQLSMTAGAGLEADVRNIPPQLGGDFEITVRRGKSVALTTADLTTYDPDSRPNELTYSVSNVVSGRIALAAAPANAVEHFTQFDIEGGRVLFVHDGSGGPRASFDVVVVDQTGGASPSRTVTAVVAGWG
jgi:cytoskeletal protein CcmA (bactofilin family)